MAIGFARFEFVQRSSGKTACGKSAYIARSKLSFNGTQFADAKTYNWSNKEKPAYHELILPKHVDSKFKSLEILWNTVEQKENRHNSQVAMEMVIALPDDQTISLEDKIELSRTFAEKYFVKNGLAVQLAIHRPDQKILLSMDTGEVEDLDHNWHAHILVPTRRFREDGQELDDHKARDLMPVVRNGKVIAGLNWGKLWTQHQNLFFEDKGLDLRVDETGIIGQKHLGPIRLRGRAFALEEENQTLSTLNHLESRDPAKILTKITETRSVFSQKDVDRYLEKHVEPKRIHEVRDLFWDQKQIVQFLDPVTKGALDKFSTTEILEEEQQIVRLANGIQSKPALKLNIKDLDSYTEKLNQEQKKAFGHIIQGRKLSCIEGHAGAGKSYLLFAIQEIYADQGYVIRALGPDNATANVLREKGLTHPTNIFRFLFSLHHNKTEISKGKEVWILDESSKLGNRPLLELLKAAEKYQAQVIFAGCSSQLPSVERGGLFKLFCERYGAQELVEIQRQKKQEQRAMTQNLAHGSMAAAIDQLANLRGLRWYEKKEEAIEALIKTWAVDQTAFPSSSSLILAHTNREVRILNEMARLYRKEKGELEEAEYVCKTFRGKIIISVGDKIEFRTNDKNLGVTNGMQGTLIEASGDRFVVALQDKTRRITFNPEEYTGFQLAYATTYFRSQGQTVERAYVLHAPQMNKEKFYVGLTRHVQKVLLFASRNEVSNIVHLKKQAFRRDLKENTLNYLTQSKLEKQKAILDRTNHIDQLNRASLIGKAKGYALSTWNSLKEAIGERLQYSYDLRPSQKFFNPRVEEAVKGCVVKIEDQYFDFDQERQQGIQKAFSKIIEVVDSAPRKKAKVVQADDSNWSRLSEQNKALLKQYYQTLNQAASLYMLVKSEGGQNVLKNSPHFKEWQMACATRNTQAYEVLKSAPQAFIREAMGKEAFDLLHTRALKHEAYLQRVGDQQPNLSEQLKERLEPLLYRLFPDGPTGKNRNGLRFGAKGSLSVICHGEQAGCFYDFERGEGGGPLKLVQRALSLNSSEAIDWSREFLGLSTEIRVPSQFNFKQQSIQQNQEWKSLKPNSGHPAPSLKEISRALNQKFHEVARHAYRDEKGDLLFYTLRLVDKDNAAKKCVLPLSYGKWQGSEDPTWALKSYSNDKRSLYQLDQLYKHPSAKVLIVEGEKTADAAKKLFLDKDIVCVTWQGGSSAVSKSDWLPLHGREIVIWPDNDQAGFKAADQLCTELRQVGVKSLSVVNDEILIKVFPEKWDLADPLPSGKSFQHLHNMVLMAKEKTLGVEQLSLYFKGNEKDLVHAKLHAHEVLWRVEERLWHSLEEKYGSRIWETKQAILNEANRLLSRQEFLERKLQTDEQLSPMLAHRMAKQLVLQEAENGKESTFDQIKELKQVIGSLNAFQLGDSKGCMDSRTTIYATDKSLADALSIGMRDDVLKQTIRAEAMANEMKFAKQIVVQQEMQAIKAMQERQKDRGLEI